MKCRDLRAGNLWKSALVSGLAALLVNLAVIAASHYCFGASLTLLAPGDNAPREMPLLNIIPESFVVSGIASVLLYLMGLILKNPWPVFICIVAAAAFMTSAGPVAHGTDPATKIALSLTHVVIGASIIAMNLILVKRKDAVPDAK